MHHLKNWKITTKCVNGEISSMAVSHIEFYSEKLEMKTRVNVILPEHVDKDGQVLLLLHGLGDDENTWFEQTRIVSYASGSNITVIMPRVDRSYYTTSVGGPKYFEYVSQEILQRCQEWFNIPNNKEQTFIAGISMGGFGALKVGLTNPKRFKQIFVMSAMPDIITNWRNNSERDEWYRSLFGTPEQIQESINDVSYLVSKQNETAPKIWQLCGRNDSFYDMNVILDQQIRKRGLKHQFVEVSGGHEWSVWDKAIKQVLNIIDDK